MKYDYPKLMTDNDLKRLHYVFPQEIRELHDLESIRKTCDLGGSETYDTVPFMEAVRLINEEGYRPCGNCLMEGGEVSNWKERAETAEANVRGLQSQLVQSDKLAADWKVRAEQAEAALPPPIGGGQ